MKKIVKDKLALMGLPNYGNRRPHLNCSHNLCTCGDTKKRHFGGKLGHSFSAGDQKNVVDQQAPGQMNPTSFPLV
jgi:hypothetical protein